MRNIMSAIWHKFSGPLRRLIASELTKHRAEMRSEISTLVEAEFKKERIAQHWIVRNELFKSQFNIHYSQLRDASDASYTYLKDNFKAAREFHDKFSLRKFLAESCDFEEGLFLEFGVYQGESLRQLAKLLPDKVLHGFDSFQGLPEEWKAGFNKGHFETELPQNIPGNVYLYDGWFSDTLPIFLEGNDAIAAFIHIDCDLYSSTKTVFELLRERIVPGTIILFDEYYNYIGWQDGEFKAFSEFVADAKLEYDYIAYNSFQCQVAIRVN